MEGLGASSEKSSSTVAPVAWATMLMTDYENANARVCNAINERVREPTQGIHTQLAIDGCAQTGIADKQTGDADELSEEGRCQSDSRLLLVKGGCSGELSFSFGMKRIAHTRPALMRAMASSPGTGATAPLSTSVSLR